MKIHENPMRLFIFMAENNAGVLTAKRGQTITKGCPPGCVWAHSEPDSRHGSMRWNRLPLPPIYENDKRSKQKDENRFFRCKIHWR